MRTDEPESTGVASPAPDGDQPADANAASTEVTEAVRTSDDGSGTSSRSPSLAAILSFILPGLGQWYARRRVSALVFAVPTIVVLAAVGLFVATEGLESVGLRLFVPAVALAVLVGVIVFGLWRLVAVVHAYQAARHRPGGGWRRRSAVVLTVLLAVIVGSHAYAGYFAYSFYRSGIAITSNQPPIVVPPAEPTPTPGPTPTLEPGATPPPSPSQMPVPTPDPTPASPQERINILFLGIDAAEGRTHALSDTMLVASFDPQTQRIAMLSFPRDLYGVPLYTGRSFDDRLNAFWSYAEARPQQFPEGGLEAMEDQIGYLLGIDIHYSAMVDLGGFASILSSLAPIELDNPSPINDPTYKMSDGQGFVLPAGPVTLDAEQAMAFARSRKGAGGSDFERARRQQLLLLAMRQKLTDPSVLLRMPELLEAFSKTVRTNLPPEQFSAMMDLAKGSTDARVRQIVLGPRSYADLIPPSEVGGIYALRLNTAAVADLSIRLFGDDSRFNTDPPPPAVP